MSKSNITFEDFKTRWKQIISKIEKEAIDGEGIDRIRSHFNKGKVLFEMGMSEDEFTHKVHVELNLLESELDTALQIAHSRFRLENRGILAKIFGGVFERISKKK